LVAMMVPPHPCPKITNLFMMVIASLLTSLSI
jgi:hypothetical protein